MESQPVINSDANHIIGKNIRDNLSMYIYSMKAYIHCNLFLAKRCKVLDRDYWLLVRIIVGSLALLNMIFWWLNINGLLQLLFLIIDYISIYFYNNWKSTNRELFYLQAAGEVQLLLKNIISVSEIKQIEAINQSLKEIESKFNLIVEKYPKIPNKLIEKRLKYIMQKEKEQDKKKV